MSDLRGHTSSRMQIVSYQFECGQRLDNLNLYYRTLGSPSVDAEGGINNAVLLLHNTTGSSEFWLQDQVASRLFGKGQPLDLSKYFVIAPDALGFGKSSKPSDGLKGQFPNFRYNDLVDLTHRLLIDELGVHKLKLIVGISMGGMLTWLIAGRYPEMVDAILPISCQPGPMSGRNWIQRKISIEAIRNDPDWNGGMYESNPQHFAFAAPIGPMMLRSVTRLQEQAPDRESADKFYWSLVERARKSDANDRLFQLEASMNYDPSPNLNRITAKVSTVSFEDDELNPIELGVVDRAIAGLPSAKHIVVPRSPETEGHLSAKLAHYWDDQIAPLLAD